MKNIRYISTCILEGGGAFLLYHLFNFLDKL